MDRTEYWVAASSYLERAKRQLAENTHEALFYAAYEVRCAVEARQDEYLKAQEEYAESIPKAWRIGAQGAELVRIFDSEKIQRIEWQAEGRPSFVAHHVPVNQDLRDRVKKLNDLLHAQTRHRKFYDRWWQLARVRVIDVYRGVWVRCQGTLLNPMLRHLDEPKLLGKVRMILDNDEVREFAAWQKPGVRVSINVSYVDAPPREWQPDVD